MSALTAVDSPATATAGRRCRRCRCRLSRYNQEDYCAACHRGGSAAPVARPAFPVHVWDCPDVREAILAREFGLLCRLIRTNGGLRQEDMAALTGLSQGYLSMLESGTRKLTHIDKIAEMLAGLHTPAELTGPMLRPRTQSPGQSRPWT